MNEKPEVGQKWKTARGGLVQIMPSNDPNIIEVDYMDIRAGGACPAQFDLNGKKIKGWEDQLTERAILY